MTYGKERFIDLHMLPLCFGSDISHLFSFYNKYECIPDHDKIQIHNENHIQTIYVNSPRRSGDCVLLLKSFSNTFLI